MRSMRSGRLVVALEEEQSRLETEAAEAASAAEQVADEQEAQADERVQEATDIADETAELDESVEDIADEHESIEEAMDTVEAMEALALVVSNARAAGTMTKVAAESMFVMLDHVDRRTGYKAPAKVSLESFGGPSSTKRAVIALEEEVQGRLAKIWEAIKAAIKRSIEWITNFVSNLFKNADRMMAKAKKLETDYNRHGQGGKPAEEKIENEKLFKALALEGKVPGDLTAVRTVNTIITGLYSHLPQVAAKIEKVIAELKATNRARVDVAYDPQEVFGAAGLKHTEASKVNAPGLDADFSATVSTELPGGKHIIIAVDKTNQAYIGLDFLKDGKAPEGKDVPLFSHQDGLTVARGVADIAKELAGGKSKVSALTSAKKRIIAGIDNSSSISKAVDKALLGKETMNAIRSSIKLLDTPFVLASSYAIHTGYALLEQAEQSLKSIKAADKKTKAA